MLTAAILNLLTLETVVSHERAERERLRKRRQQEEEEKERARSAQTAAEHSTDHRQRVTFGKIASPATGAPPVSLRELAAHRATRFRARRINQCVVACDCG